MRTTRGRPARMKTCGPLLAMLLVTSVHANGDLNGDGFANALDLNLLSRAVAGGNQDLSNDLDGDGQISLADVSHLRTEIGDLNDDGELTVADLDLLHAAVRDAFENGLPDLRFDLDGDGRLRTYEDRDVWVRELYQTWVGDSNLDGQYDSGDLVLIFQAARYETGEPAGWTEGDWDGNGLFGTNDLIDAF